jgi:hypothetical protein
MVFEFVTIVGYDITVHHSSSVMSLIDEEVRMGSKLRQVF